MTLDHGQALVVEAPLDARQIVVMSGPGSGKTRTAVERVKRLVAAGQKVVVITYTNAAAQEFARRIQDFRQSIHQVSHFTCPITPIEFCGTLHSYCFRLIRQFYAIAGYDSANVTVLPEDDREALLKQISGNFGIKMATKIRKPSNDPRAREVWKEYYFQLRQNNLIDYEHILARGVDLLLDARVRDKVRIDTLVVDEAQDSAAIDWAVYVTIPAKQRFFIGDPDQAIFEWREAYPQGLIDKGKEPMSTVYRLENNYRCAPVICDAANNLIKHNVSRFEKNTVPAHDAYLAVGTMVTVVAHDDEWQELEWLAMAIRRWEPCSRAVLCRYNWDIDQIRRYLPTVGIHVYAARDQADAKPIDWRRAMLLIGLAIEPFNEYLAEQYLLLDHEPTQVAAWKCESRAQKENLGFRLHPHGMVDGFNLLRRLSSMGVRSDTVDLIGKHMEDLEPDATLADLQASLHQLQERPAPQRADTVYTGTIHSAKGREFDVVFLPRFEERKKTDANIEEERRLVFVALTRARHAVHISWARVRYPQWGGGGIQGCEPSRFIKEMKLTGAQVRQTT